jgi:hypothetical protein
MRLHPVLDPVTIIETKAQGIELAVVQLVQTVALINGDTASALARTTAELEARIATHRDAAQLRRIVAEQIAVCRRHLERTTWSLEVQHTRIILTQHEGASS